MSFLFSFSEIHILREFVQALVIPEWLEIKIFNGINTILNTRNIYILVSFFCSRDTNLLLGMSMTKHMAQWKVKNGHIDIHIIIGKKKLRI